MSMSPSPLAVPSPGRTAVFAARAAGLPKVYGAGETRVVALDDVSVDFPHGEYTAIVVPPGRVSRR